VDIKPWSPNTVPAASLLLTATSKGADPVEPWADADVFREQAREKLGPATPGAVELGALFLWEKTLPKTEGLGLTPRAGAMTGYLTSLGIALGNSSGALPRRSWKRPRIGVPNSSSPMAAKAPITSLPA
jgi:hypothetical protein